MVPGGAFANPSAPTPRNRQTSCIHTTKATIAPRQVPKGLPPRLQAAPEARGGVSCSPERLGPAPPLGVSKPTRCTRGARGVPAVAAAPGAPPPRARGTRAGAHLPARLPCSVTLLSRLLTERDLGTRLCASPATPLSAAPSPAAAFLFLPSPQAPAPQVSHAARLQGSQGSRRPPHPRPGAALRPRRRSPCSSL